MNGAAPNSSWTGSQFVWKTKPRPKRRTLGSAVIATCKAMESSTTAMPIANAAHAARKTRSPRLTSRGRDTMGLLEDDLLARLEALQLPLRLRDDLGRESRVVQRLTEFLAVVDRPPEKLRGGL